MGRARLTAPHLSDICRNVFQDHSAGQGILWVSRDWVPAANHRFGVVDLDDLRLGNRRCNVGPVKDNLLHLLEAGHNLQADVAFWILSAVLEEKPVLGKACISKVEFNLF